MDLLSRWQALGGASGPPLDAGTAPELSKAWSEVREALAPIEHAVPDGPFGGAPLEAVRERIHALGTDRLTPYRLPEIHAIRDLLLNAGLEPLLRDLRQQGVAPQHWTARLEHVWLHSTLEEALAAEPALAAFSGRAHDDLVAEFSRLDRDLLRLAADRVRRLAAERAIRAMDEHFDQADLVQREARKRARHVPLRELFARAPDVLTRIAPCWIASPLSVSQLLDPSSRHFDLVVFDEASQVLQEEAVPALYRAGQVVVAGDRHQLPPTTFFATAIEGEDEISEEDESLRRAAATATAAIGGFESLLDTLGAFLPNWMLEWHYRSEDERLIAFSNEHIYRRQLVTFPGARGRDAIRHVLVPHDPALGSQEESASREVGEIVRLVLEHARSRPDESLGVITMGIKHANRVQAALDRALESERTLGDFFSLDREERFFVKNLETVQGDERDAILLSVGYGKSANGDLPHRFGPLTQDTGHRRLNVAVTRARRRMTVVSSFSHQEVDLGRSGSRGVQLLKAYLEFAASGGTRLPESESAGDVAPNPFEVDVQDALEGRGIRTRAQFGASRFRIDLVAMHPGQHGRAILAIECDGATYHSGATARDRDRLRQAHLMRLGWRFHRIWSTDWFHNRDEEVQRVVDAYEDAARRADLADVADSRQGSPRPTVGPEEEQPLDPAPEREPRPAPARPRGPRPAVPNRESIEEYHESEILELFAWVRSDGLLRTQEELVREVFDLLPFARMGTRIRARLEAAAEETRGATASA
jgi:very-short-patch-repair endonuclease